MSTLLIDVRDLTKRFDHQGTVIEVLSGLDLQVERGEQVAIVGKSGAGKSTLLHILGTLDAPSSGTIRVLGEDISKLSPKALAEFRNRTIGFMFQFHHLLPDFTALENVMMPLLIRRTPRVTARDEAERLLSRVGLAERLSHRPGELSGGEQQRVTQPALLLADEPTGNLDQATSSAIHGLFEDLVAQHGTALIIVTHNTTLAAQAQRRLQMVKGRLVPEDVAEHAS